ncbi:protein transport protein S31 [Rhodotorula kratochvilovae]
MHILASSSNSGMMVVWDLKTKREITALSYSGAGATDMGPGFGASGGFGGMGAAGGMSARGGHSVLTKLVTAGEDDHAPFPLTWDLRNWKEAERVLLGHDTDILSLSFLPSDPDLLLASGKDGRTLAWSLAAGPPVAKVAPAPACSWTFDASSCPMNPSFVETSSLDGTVGVHNLQSTNAPSEEDDDMAPPAADTAAAAADAGSFFSCAITANACPAPALSLSVPPGLGHVCFWREASDVLLGCAFIVGGLLCAGVAGKLAAVQDVETVNWHGASVLVMTYASPFEPPAPVAHLGHRLECRWEESKGEGEWRVDAIAFGAVSLLGRMCALLGEQARKGELATLTSVYRTASGPLALITSAPAPNVAPFQAALKLLVQRMQSPQ